MCNLSSQDLHISFVHILSLSSFSSLCIIPLFLFSCEVTSDRSIGLTVETGTALDTARVDSAVLGADLGLFAVLPVLHQLGHRVICQILIEVLVIDLDHRGVDAGAKALDLLQREQTILTSLIHVNSIEVLDSLDNVSCL